MAVENPGSSAQRDTIDPELAQIIANGGGPQFAKGDTVDRIPSARTLWAEVNKNKADELLQAAEPNGISLREIGITCRDGSTNRALVYSQDNSELEKPLVVLFHGGGYAFGSPEMEAKNCIDLATHYNAVAISVGYRLAPEYKFPIQIQDCWDSLRWIAKHAEDELSANPSRGFVIGGTSAGGNLACNLSHLARDEGLSHPITGVYLCVPSLLDDAAVKEEHRSLYSSRVQNRHAPILNKAAMDVYAEAYGADPQSHLYSPLNWPTGHKDQPPTYFQICGLDVLRDEVPKFMKICFTD
ncbi:hypothetical protein G7054_g13131 [Neopestalotiopsis clavispora]|nr:hypothetical protein G7054_g13131 [Neopestalotiopsis clavispora]